MTAKQTKANTNTTRISGGDPYAFGWYRVLVDGKVVEEAALGTPFSVKWAAEKDLGHKNFTIQKH
jgi:hypothetical protein